LQIGECDRLHLAGQTHPQLHKDNQETHQETHRGHKETQRDTKTQTLKFTSLPSLQVSHQRRTPHRVTSQACIMPSKVRAGVHMGWRVWLVFWSVGGSGVVEHVRIPFVPLAVHMYAWPGMLGLVGSTSFPTTQKPTWMATPQLRAAMRRRWLSARIASARRLSRCPTRVSGLISQVLTTCPRT
jgi:hypothetical protein